MKNETYFVVIPYPVLVDPELSDVDRIVYGEISALTNKEGYCFASNKYIAEVLNKTVSTTRRSIYKLTERGYISVDISKEDGNTRKIYLHISVGNNSKMNIPMFKNEHTLSSKMNTIDNNIDNNIDKLAAPKPDKSGKSVDNSPVLAENVTTEEVVPEQHVERRDPITGFPIDGQKGNTKMFRIPPAMIHNGVVSLAEVIAARPPMEVTEQDDPVKTSHQAYGLEAVDDLKLPSQYKNRIIGACKDMPLHVIESAVEGTIKKGIKDAEGRAKYFFTCLHNNR